MGEGDMCQTHFTFLRLMRGMSQRSKNVESLRAKLLSGTHSPFKCNNHILSSKICEEKPQRGKAIYKAGWTMMSLGESGGSKFLDCVRTVHTWQISALRVSIGPRTPARGLLSCLLFHFNPTSSLVKLIFNGLELPLNGSMEISLLFIFHGQQVWDWIRKTKHWNRSNYLLLIIIVTVLTKHLEFYFSKEIFLQECVLNIPKVKAGIFIT